MLFAAIIKVFSRLDGKSDELFQRWEDLSEEVDIFISMEEIQIFLELFKADFISNLVLAVLVSFFLNGIVGQMNVLVGAVLHRKFIT